MSQETQASATGKAPQAQIAESAIGGSVIGPQASANASPTSGQPLGPTAGTSPTPINAVPNPIAGPLPVVTGPPTAAGLPNQGPGAITNDPMQEQVRAKFISSPGYVVPAPSFSYSVLPRPNAAAGNLRQSSSTPAIKLNPPVPAAALQPPVPGQSSVMRPSFSYSVVSHTVNPATGQQFQPATATSQAHLRAGAFIPVTSSSLQPPVPGQSSGTTSGVPGGVRMNLLATVPKGLESTSSSDCGGSSQSAAADTSQKIMPSNSDTSVAVSPEPVTAPATASSQSTKSLVQSFSNSITTPAAPSNLNHATTWMPVSPSPTTPGMSGANGMLGPPGLPSSASVLPIVTGRPTGADSSALSQRPVMQSPVSVPSNSVSLQVPVPQNVQQQIYSPYPSLPMMAPSPQAVWVHPPQAGNLQRPPFLPYPGAVHAPFQMPMRGSPLPSVPFPNVQPPGVSTMLPPGGTPSASGVSHQPHNNLGIQTPSPNCDHDKQANSLTNNDSMKHESDAWTAHKTDAGSVYYYNSLTGESTYEKPSSFKGEPDKATVQPTPVSWEKLSGTDWTLVTTNDGKKYYYDTKNKISSWQVPAEVAELRKSKENDSLKANANSMENVITSAPFSLNAPAVHTGGRDATTPRTSNALVSSSALDLIKKKLQDAGTPITSSPLPASSAPASSAPVTSDSNGPKAVEATVKGQHSENSKDKLKDANGEGNISESSSDSEDIDSGPTKDECIIQFKEMLKERGVAPFSKWDKELPKIIFDQRFKAVPGYSVRRSLFERYVRTRAEEERKEKRAAQKAATEGFKNLLEEASEDIDHKTDYQTFKRKWGTDPRFEALDRKERELLLNERILPLKKAAEEKIKAVRAAFVSSFKSMLREKGDITWSSRWSRVKDSFRNDPRYKSVKHEDREFLFNEFISELRAAEDEAEHAAKAKRDEQEKLKRREQEMRKRKQREEQEIETLRLKVLKKEAESSYQSLLVETIKDPKASWTESKPKLEKDPQGRATNPDLDQAYMEKLFRDHVKNLYERCVREFRSLLADVITGEVANRATNDGKTVLTSWSEAKRLLKPDSRYSKMPRKERESIWSRYVEDTLRKQKSASASDPKEKHDTEGKSRSPRKYLSRR